MPSVTPIQRLRTIVVGPERQISARPMPARSPDVRTRFACIWRPKAGRSSATRSMARHGADRSRVRCLPAMAIDRPALHAWRVGVSSPGRRVASGRDRRRAARHAGGPDRRGDGRLGRSASRRAPDRTGRLRAPSSRDRSFCCASSADSSCCTTAVTGAGDRASMSASSTIREILAIESRGKSRLEVVVQQPLAVDLQHPARRKAAEQGGTHFRRVHAGLVARAQRPRQPRRACRQSRVDCRPCRSGRRRSRRCE